MRVDLAKLAYKTGDWKVPQWPSTAWRAWKMSSYSVQEAGGSEQRGLIMPTQSQKSWKLPGELLVWVKVGRIKDVGCDVYRKAQQQTCVHPTQRMPANWTVPSPFIVDLPNLVGWGTHELALEASYRHKQCAWPIAKLSTQSKWQSRLIITLLELHLKYPWGSGEVAQGVNCLLPSWEDLNLTWAPT